MKKILLTVVAMLLFGAAATAQTQRDCAAIMRPYFDAAGMDPDEYPAEKTEFRCLVSWYTFYLTDQIPPEHIYFQFNELTNLLDGTHPAANTQVNLATLSYYQYNFAFFQGKDMNRTIYFELQGNKHRYLALRPYVEAFNMANDAIYGKAESTTTREIEK